MSILTTWMGSCLSTFACKVFVSFKTMSQLSPTIFMSFYDHLNRFQTHFEIFENFGKKFKKSNFHFRFSTHSGILPTWMGSCLSTFACKVFESFRAMSQLSPTIFMSFYDHLNRLKSHFEVFEKISCLLRIFCVHRIHKSHNSDQFPRICGRKVLQQGR